MQSPEGLEDSPLNLLFTFLAGILNFKFRIVFWNIFFWRFEKRIALSEKKATFSRYFTKTKTIMVQNLQLELSTVRFGEIPATI